MVSVKSARCDACGASLSLPGKGRFATCTFCGTELEIVRTESSLSTQKLEKQIAQQGKVLQKTSKRVARIERRLQEEELEDDWERQRDALMLTGKHGQKFVPTKPMAVVTGVVAVIGGGAFSSFASSMEGATSTPLPLFGGFFAVVGLGMGVWIWAAAERYEQARIAHAEEVRRLGVESFGRD